MSLTADKFEATNGNPPGVRVRFTWIEPNHQVVELLQKHNLTDSFHSVDGTYILDNYLFETLDKEKASEYVDLKAQELVNAIGNAIAMEQTKTLPPTVSEEAATDDDD